jgi:hypothetical protein
MLQTLLSRFRKDQRRRVVIVHNHVFKNAGSTIDWILRKQFGNRFVDHRDNEAMQGGTAYLEGFFRSNPQVQALSSHHLALPLPQMEQTEFYLLMMYRHPLERVVSAYHFERAQVQANTLGALFAREHGLREYVLWRMRPEVPPTIRNFHIARSLPTPVKWDRHFTEADLEQAKRLASSLPLLGIVERFDESMTLFEETLRPLFPSIDLAYVPQNMRRDQRTGVAERIAQLAAEIGEQAFDRLQRGNELDTRLHEYAVSLFQERIAGIPGFDEKVRGFRARLLKISSR